MRIGNENAPVAGAALLVSSFGKNRTTCSGTLTFVESSTCWDLKVHAARTDLENSAHAGPRFTVVPSVYVPAPAGTVVSPSRPGPPLARITPSRLRVVVPVS